MPADPTPGEYPNQFMGWEGVNDANIGAVNQFSSPIQFSSNAGVVAATIYSGANAPTIGGNVGDLYIRTNPAGDSTYFYRCTTAGTAGNAIWAAITGA